MAVGAVEAVAIAAALLAALVTLAVLVGGGILLWRLLRAREPTK